MQDYPLVLDAALILDKETAAYITRSMDMKINAVPDSIAKLSDEVFAQLAKNEALPEYYSDGYMCEMLSAACFVSDFTGTITTLFPEKARRAIGENDPESRWESFFYIPASKAADLFSVAYASPDELLTEFKETFSKEGLELPADFDWWRRLVRITGTVYC